MRRWKAGLIAMLAIAASSPSLAQSPPVETAQAALARDAAEYAVHYAVPPAQALDELRLRRSSLPTTDALSREFAARLVGITIDREPTLHATVQLSGDEPVADRVVPVGGSSLPVLFRTGFQATQSALVSAITQHQAAIRASLLRPPGIGIDPRTGEMLVLVSQADVAATGMAELGRRFGALTGVPVRVESSGEQANMAVTGGARLVGHRGSDGRRFICTSGFVVTDGARDGIATAAHCPDDLGVISDGETVDLPFVSQAGWGYQDVQINAAVEPLVPVFFADTAKAITRPVDQMESRASTRVGDFVCHRGERTGYSCSEVLMTDFAPAGDLCGGACLPTWVAVAGPTCGAGDSGGPVFSGTTAIGLLKGGTYRPDGSCVMYYYMSLDYLPTGWSVMQSALRRPLATGSPVAQP